MQASMQPRASVARNALATAMLTLTLKLPVTRSFRS